MILDISCQPIGFKESQLKFERVANAYKSKEKIVMAYLNDNNIGKDQFEVFFRAFKREEIFEVWGKQKNENVFHLLQTYPICASSGVLGPKRKEGDLQVPEGFYEIDKFNPLSSYHLAFRVNYPNSSDRILSNKTQPGSDIYVHGKCCTIGCLPMTDDFMNEIYIFAVEARNNGQKSIPVHIFPTHLNAENFEKLHKEFSDQESLISFWKGLQSAYFYFEENKILPKILVQKDGAYKIQE